MKTLQQEKTYSFEELILQRYQNAQLRETLISLFFRLVNIIIILSVTLVPPTNKVQFYVYLGLFILLNVVWHLERNTLTNQINLYEREYEKLVISKDPERTYEDSYIRSKYNIASVTRSNISFLEPFVWIVINSFVFGASIIQKISSLLPEK